MYEQTGFGWGAARRASDWANVQARQLSVSSCPDRGRAKAIDCANLNCRGSDPPPFVSFIFFFVFGSLFSYSASFFVFALPELVLHHESKAQSRASRGSLALPSQER
jgi:hypothetical protein